MTLQRVSSLCAILLFGCGDAPTTALDSSLPDGVVFDGGGRVDGGLAFDGGPAFDAGPSDGGPVESGVDMDSLPDGGPPDDGGRAPECDRIIGPDTPPSQRFDGISAGEVLCLEDGNYSGGLNVPSGVTVSALRIGGPLFVGGDDDESAVLLMEGDGSTVSGVRAREPDHARSNACEIGGTNNTLRSSGCAHGGAYKHKVPLRLSGSGHLVEDSWFFGEGRYVVQCFIGDHITVRRNVARWDSTAPNEPMEPNATFSNYNCSYNLWENNISLDYGVPETPMRFGGDFYSPHNQGRYPTGNIHNRWLGNFAVNHALGTDNRRGFRADSNTGLPMVGNVVSDFFVRDNGVGFVIKPTYEVAINRCTMENVVNGAGNIGGQAIECEAPANIENRYIDGESTSELLWPFANEGIIKAEMCAAGERVSEWCSFSGTLREYVLGL